LGEWLGHGLFSANLRPFRAAAGKVHLPWSFPFPGGSGRYTWAMPPSCTLRE
jgi:hypothetical protein